MKNSKKTQQMIEQQLEKYSGQAVDTDKTITQIYGPMQDWTLELGSQTLLLHPLEKAWYYLDQLHQTWEPTGFGPGEAQFVAVGNKLGVRHFEDVEIVSELEEAETVLRPQVKFLLAVRAPEFSQPLPVIGEITIGRGKENDIMLKDTLASRQHARLYWDGKTLSIEDLGTTNGTEVNGKAITAKTPLKPGDEILVGDTHIKVLAADASAKTED